MPYHTPPTSTIVPALVAFVLSAIAQPRQHREPHGARGGATKVVMGEEEIGLAMLAELSTL